jgi:predicted esterase
MKAGIDLVFLHGYDSRPGAMLGLAESLSESFQDSEKRLLAGPVRLTDGDRGSFAWWQADYDEDDVDASVDWLSKKLNKPTVLIGFSQGGALALAAASRGVPNVIGVVAMSAFLPDGFDVSDFDGALLLMHGEDDDVVDAFHSERLHRHATKAGVDCELVLATGGHTIPDDRSALTLWLVTRFRQ